MVYIRPSTRIPPNSLIKPTAATEPVQAQEKDLAVNLPAEESFVFTTNNDRRKRRERRKESRTPLLETRVGKDRRKSDVPSISISV